MSLQSAWDPSWIVDQTSVLVMDLFRMVETQHIAATMRLVDSANEQALLEQMLEESKPPRPARVCSWRALSLGGAFPVLSTDGFAISSG